MTGICGVLLGMLCMFAQPATAHAEVIGDFDVTTSNGGSTHWDGENSIVQLMTAGDYTITMKDGVTTTIHRIQVLAPSGEVNLTLDGVTLASRWCFEIRGACTTKITLPMVR